MTVGAGQLASGLEAASADWVDPETSWSADEGPGLVYRHPTSRMRSCGCLRNFNGEFTKLENSACFIID